MEVRVQFVAIIAIVFLIAIVISMIRQRLLREEYAIMWLIAGVVLVTFALWRDLIDILANTIGVYYAPAVLLLLGIFFGVLITLHFTVALSRHENCLRDLTQEIALLKAEGMKHQEDGEL